MYHYTDHDIARMYHEPAKRSMLVSHQDERGPFARDRARVFPPTPQKRPLARVCAGSRLLLCVMGTFY